METSTLITFQVLLENIFDDVWMMFLIQFEVILQPFPFNSKVSNIVNVVLHSHNVFYILPIGSFLLIA